MHVYGCLLSDLGLLRLEKRSADRRTSPHTRFLCSPSFSILGSAQSNSRITSHCTAVRSDMKTSVYALEALNEDFREREVTIDEPDHDEVLVKIVASGICHSDLNVVNGISPMDLPAVVGHEGTGIVEQVGSLVKGVKVTQPDPSAAFSQELKTFPCSSLATRWSYAGYIAVHANDVTEVSAVSASSGLVGIC